MLIAYQLAQRCARPWRADTTLTVTLTATTGFVLLILGFAFHWQAARAREADVDLRHRAQPHRHRAQPRPLRVVGLGPRPRPHLLVAFDVRDPRHRAARRPADLRRGQRAWSIPTTSSSIEVAAQLADAKASSIDHEFRMLHASGKWVLAAGALRAGAAARAIPACT